MNRVVGRYRESARASSPRLGSDSSGAMAKRSAAMLFWSVIMQRIRATSPLKHTRYRDEIRLR